VLSHRVPQNYLPRAHWWKKLLCVINSFIEEHDWWSQFPLLAPIAWGCALKAGDRSQDVNKFYNPEKSKQARLIYDKRAMLVCFFCNMDYFSENWSPVAVKTLQPWTLASSTHPLHSCLGGRQFLQTVVNTDSKLKENFNCSSSCQILLIVLVHILKLIAAG
jgi:hypothetical protein